MDCIATFFTHFGAVLFSRRLKAMGIPYRMAPVPRRLSSSCGTCVFFQGEDSLSADCEDLEALYRIEGENYFLLEKEKSS